MGSTARPFDKYDAYARSVQASRDEAKFLSAVYRDVSGQEPKTLREDFCGTYALCCEWVKLGPEKRAIGIDIDREPLAYGAHHHRAALDAHAQLRVIAHQRDVLKGPLPRADVICALNFSYFCLHSRQSLLRYFKSCRRSLSPGGVFVVDTFGGPQHHEPSLDTRRLPGLTYYFEQEFFDPISNRTRFSLHYKPLGGRIRKRAFTYDWRMWSIAEVRDVMLDAGFKDAFVFWEGTARDGRGSGRFTRKERGEPCQVWVAYVVGRV